jgi:hypothetical protein
VARLLIVLFDVCGRHTPMQRAFRRLKKLKVKEKDMRNRLQKNK